MSPNATTDEGRAKNRRVEITDSEITVDSHPAGSRQTVACRAFMIPLGRLVVRPRPCIHAYPGLPALDEFRAIWSGLRAESQLRQTLDYVPRNAGPHQSNALVHRLIELACASCRRDTRRQFLSYVDDLAWIERVTAGGPSGEKDVPQAASIGKRPKGKRVRR